MNHNRFPFFLIVLALILSALACTLNIGGPAYPTPPIPVSTEAVQSLQEGIQAAVEAGSVSGQLTLTINETQLTSYLAFLLQSQSQPLITNPQVLLRDGMIRVYGIAQSGYFQATVYIELTATVDEQGQLKIELANADFGPLPVPQGLKDAVTAIITEAYTGALGPVATGFRLEGILIADGMMALTGRLK